MTITLDELSHWTPGSKARLGVLGFPIKHSVSPAMHNAALAVMAEQQRSFSDWHYYRFEIPPESLGEALKRLHKLRFQGLNLTVPHKVLALNEVIGASPEGKAMGAVNTLLWKPEGYYGYNTDGYGLTEGLKYEFGTSVQGKHVLLLGAGGAARAAAWQCLSEGCAALWIGNRSVDRLQELVTILKEGAHSDKIHPFALQEIHQLSLPEEGILINSTSCGLSEKDPSPIPLERLGKGWTVFDMIYRKGDTLLVREAGKRGLKAAGGLSMLVFQGAKSLEIWSGQTVPVEAMFKAVKQQLENGST